MNVPPIGISVTDLLIESGLVSSRAEAIRSIVQGGVKLGDVKVESSFARLALNGEKFVLLDFTIVQSTKVFVREIIING